MTDTRTLSYINLHAILGSLPMLCALDSRAGEILGKKRMTVGISVSGGSAAPGAAGILSFENGRCTYTECAPGSPDVGDAKIVLTFPTPEKFNGMIDGTVTPIPKKGLLRAGFLTGPFTRLTDLLTAYLRPKDEDLADPAFFRISTMLMFHVIARSVCCIGNEDAVGRASASYIHDGAVLLAAGNEISFAVRAENHRLSLSPDPTEETITAEMRFADLLTARALFDGKINSVASVGDGLISIRGMIPQVDNINRILDRVALYLA